MKGIIVMIWLAALWCIGFGLATLLNSYDKLRGKQ